MVSAVKLRVLIGEKWDPENWNVDIWEDPNETEKIEPLNSDESSLPVEAALPPLSEAINHTLPEEAVMASPKIIALQDGADFFQDPPPTPPFASRYIRVRVKSQHSPEDEA